MPWGVAAAAVGAYGAIKSSKNNKDAVKDAKGQTAAQVSEQAELNSKAAIQNANLNRIDQTNPYGSLTYTQNGKYEDGTPKYTQTQSFNPIIQKQFDAQQQQNLNLLGAEDNLVGQINGQSNTSLNPDANDLAKTRDAYYNQQKSYLDPQFESEQKKLQTQLSNAGVVQGSDAYNEAMDSFNRQRTFSYNNAQNNAITQGGAEQSRLFNLGIAARNQPLNEFNSLRNGTQINNPAYSSVANASVQPVDAMGQYNQNYANNVANSNNQTSGLFNLAGSIGQLGKSVDWGSLFNSKNAGGSQSDYTGNAYSSWVAGQ